MQEQQPHHTASPARYSVWFVGIVALFVTCLLTANITAVKLVTVFGLLVPAGIVIFPLSYIIGDVLTEVYGYQQARRVIWLGFVCNLIAVLAIWAGQVLPAASFWDGQGAMNVSSATPRVCWSHPFWPILSASLPMLSSWPK